MSFKFHQVALTKICRICSNKIRVTDRKPILCKDYNKEIKTVFDVSTWEDVSGQHPHSLCDLCGRKVRHQRAGTREYDSGKVKNRQTVVGTEWPKHQRTGSCYVCDLFHQQEKGGPRQKPKRGPGPLILKTNRSFLSTQRLKTFSLIFECQHRHVSRMYSITLKFSAIVNTTYLFAQYACVYLIDHVCKLHVSTISVQLVYLRTNTATQL